jgi:hypothetical protein
LAILFANTKKKKRTVDLLTLARSCDYLVKKYGSRKEVAKKVGLSPEMIREILLPLNLPRKIQDAISKRKIDSIDVVREIAALRDQTKQLEVGSLFTKLPTKDIRDIRRLTEESGVTVQEATDTMLKFKERDMHVFIIDFEEAAYKAIKMQADRLGFSPAILVKGLIQAWARSLGDN